jgi:hypothetical protein
MADNPYQAPASSGQQRPTGSAPRVVALAAWIWVVTGVLYVLIALGLAASTGIPIAAMTVFVVVALFALAFFVVGVQTLRGTQKDTLGNGVGSIGIGVIGLVGTAQSAATTSTTLAGYGFEVMLIVAGALALGGRDAYRAWRATALQ